MTCFFCKGDLEDKLTIFAVDHGDQILIIKDVPSEVCTQCGEVVYSNGVTKRVEQIIEELKKQPALEIAVAHYR